MSVDISISRPRMDSAMGDGVPIRNSRMLSLFDEMLHSSLGSSHVVELLGRGIAAEARCNLAVLKDKLTVSPEPQAVLLQRASEGADLLVEWGTIEGDLAGAWRRRCANELDDPAFETLLDIAVRHLEAWPARWLKVEAG